METCLWIKTHTVIKYNRLSYRSSITPFKILTSHCTGTRLAESKIYIERQRHFWRINNEIGALDWETLALLSRGN